jgi:hypothetical protein
MTDEGDDEYEEFTFETDYYAKVLAAVRAENVALQARLSAAEGEHAARVASLEGRLEAWTELAQAAMDDKATLEALLREWLEPNDYPGRVGGIHDRTERYLALNSDAPQKGIR